MAAVTLDGIDALRELVGQRVGPTEWRTITQEQIDAFADLSGDHQWIHTDPERAAKESPFGVTVAHGNLTLSLIDGFRGQLIEQRGVKMGINYGWDKVRFPAPVPSGSRVRAAPSSSRSTSSATAGGTSSRGSSSRSRARQARLRGRRRRPRPRCVARSGAYLTVSVPFMPACSWLSTEQKNV